MLQKVMIIRHGEKPTADPEVGGVDVAGRPDADSLSPLGWQRAGALVQFFAPTRVETICPGLAVPDVLVGGAPGTADSSKRPILTISPLAAALRPAPFVTSHEIGAEDSAAADILGRSGSVLVCWEHRRIKLLVAALTTNTQIAPHWKKDRFDMVLVLDRSGDDWRLSQIPQLLLPGDRDDPLPPRGDDDNG